MADSRAYCCHYITVYCCTMGKRDRRKPGAGPKLGAAASHAKPSAASHAPKQSAAGISKNQKRREKARAKEGLVAAPGAAATVAAAPPARGGTEPSTSGRPPALAYGSRSQGGRMRGAPSMLDKMRQKLQGGHFRWLNEQLYTTQGYEALDLMRGDPALYQQYHEGAGISTGSPFMFSTIDAPTLK